MSMSMSSSSSSNKLLVHGILSSLLQGCNSMEKLRKIHAQILVNGYQDDPTISNKLLNFCAVSISGSLPYATLVFTHSSAAAAAAAAAAASSSASSAAAAWNSMIRGFSQSPTPLEAVLYYNQMMFQGLSRPDNFTFSFLLKACEKAKQEQKCREVHGSIIRVGYIKDVVVCTNLVRSYAGNGSVQTAQRVFDEMPQRDLVSWNAMIACYSQAGLHDEALKIYTRMRNSDVGPDEFTVVSLLSSCAHVGALNFGVQIHRFVDENGFLEDNVFVGNALIDMYAKCGSLEGALRVFDRMRRRRRRDVFSWNSMIIGLGVHGHGDKAITFFSQMLTAGVQPNSITFLGLLCGCSHQGLVEEGTKLFRMMRSVYHLEPGVKHYGCMVDLFGRAGKLEKALEMIGNSPIQEDPVLWRILLGACKIHKNLEIGEEAMRNLVNLKALNAGDCVLLAGIYGEVKDQQGIARMRKLIKNQGIKTIPGWSWIEVNNSVHRFVVDDKSHCDSVEIYSKLKEIIYQATLVGYAEEESLVTAPDSSEECPGNLGSYHSEKLAIAFGLARTLDGENLRIVKNLRVCRDCHSFTKAVSKAFNREIIVRDRVRFHHFKNGACSCNDYW